MVSLINIMSDKAINVKYPNENAPSLVYTNERGTIYYIYKILV